MAVVLPNSTLFMQKVHIKFAKFYTDENPPDIMGFPKVMGKFRDVLPHIVNEDL